MKHRIVIVAGGPHVLNPGDGPEGAGFIGIRIPSYERPLALFGIPVADLPNALIEPLLQPNAQAYADVDLDPPEDDPNIVAVFGMYLENEPGPISVSNLEIIRPH